jgi:PA14 domain
VPPGDVTIRQWIVRTRTNSLPPAIVTGSGASGTWRRAGLALELMLLAAAAIAGLLTAGTLILLKTGTTRLVEPATARRGWLLVAGLAVLGTLLARWLPAPTVARHRRPLRLLLAVALAWAALGLLRPALRAGDGLTAQYFNNDRWDGWPAGSFVDTRIATGRLRERWNGVPPERFSARWIGFLAVGRAGRYRFSTTSDDGSRLYIDDQLVVDNGGAHSAATRSGEVELTRGAHRVRLDYVQFGGDIELGWTWARGDGRDRPVPAWLLSRRPVGFGTVFAARALDFALFASTLLVLLAAVAYVHASFGSETVREVLDPLTSSVTNRYPDKAAFVFSVGIFISILCVPWPGGRDQWSFFRSVVTTVRDVNGTAGNTLRSFPSFQSNLNTPAAGEEILPVSVREMVSMLDAHRIERFMISSGVAANAWVYQQIIASAWPRTLEHDAKARFLLNTEPLGGCSLVESRTETSLVHCP